MNRWYVFAARAAVAFALAFLLLLIGEERVGNTIFYLGMFWVAQGTALLLALRIRRPVSRVEIAAGWITIAGGVALVLRPLLQETVFGTNTRTFLGVTAIVIGVVGILQGRSMRERLGDEWGWGGRILGLLEVLLGIAVLATTEFDTSTRILGVIWTLAAGTVLTIGAVRLRRFEAGEGGS